jgi:hypothetical protein
MREIQELIDELGKPGADLEDALIKAQVLAHGVDDAEFSAWVQAEIEGYPNDNVPDYRRLRMTIIGTIGNGYVFQNNQPIAIRHLTDEQIDILTHHPVTEGIGGVKLHARHEQEGQRFGIHVSPEMCAALSKAYTEDIFVQRATFVPSSGAYGQILTQIRTRLLRFALILQERNAALQTAGDTRSMVEPVALSHLLNGASFGNNNTIHIGHHGTVTAVSNTAGAGELADLIRLVQAIGLDEGAAIELKEAVAADSKAGEAENGKPGGRVTAWLGTLGRTAGTAVLSAGARAAIEAAIKAYFGMG